MLLELQLIHVIIVQEITSFIFRYLFKNITYSFVSTGGSLEFLFMGRSSGLNFDSVCAFGYDVKSFLPHEQFFQGFLDPLDSDERFRTFWMHKSLRLMYAWRC